MDAKITYADTTSHSNARDDVEVDVRLTVIGKDVLSIPVNPHFPDEFGFCCTRRPNLR
jgi:hypothetical protein